MSILPAQEGQRGAGKGGDRNVALDWFSKQAQPNPRPAQRAGHYIMTNVTDTDSVKNRLSHAK
jgi:hypothetical protein